MLRRALLEGFRFISPVKPEGASNEEGLTAWT